MGKLFNTMRKDGYNQYSVWCDGKNYTLKCGYVEGDIDFGIHVVDITQEEYNELQDACIQSDTDDKALRTVASYILYKRMIK